MDKIIPQTQSSFIRGHQTTDNILATQEIIHSLRTTKRKNGAMVVKIDFEKAFDKID